MPLLYPIKRVFRTWKLFLALLIGITLASTFFAGIDVKANVTAKQALDQQLSSVYVDMEFTTQLNSSNLVKAQTAVKNVEGVTDVEVISRSWAPTWLSSENYTIERYVRVASLADTSRVYDGWLNRPAEDIGENETYIVENSYLASQTEIGDVIQTTFQFYGPEFGNVTNFSLNLTVKGFAKLNDEAYSIASGFFGFVSPILPVAPQPNQKYYGADVLLLSWENTTQKMWNEVPNAAFDSSFLVYLNRDALISPWDAQTSINNIKRVAGNIENKMLADFGKQVSVQSNLEQSLQFFQFTFMAIRFTFTIVSLPIFFMAWYLGTTVSDVSFNLRRREIGLLSTKGFSSGQIQRMFFIETLLIGFIGGILGVLGGFLLNPVFTGFNIDALFNPQIISPYTMVFTVAFGIILAFLSTFSSARKASKLPTVDALKEYLPMEAEKPHRKRLPWLAFILGTYKIVVFILGVNMTVELTRIVFSGGNFILTLFAGLFLALDGILNYIGPLLFFWGFTKLFIQNSLKFQELTTKTARFVGDLGALAAKNVRRNPVRSAAIAFLIALIIGYSIQVTGQLASEQDYTTRQIHYRVGADIAVNVVNVSEAPSIVNSIVANVSETKSATIEYLVYLRQAEGMTLKAIEPHSWLETAYYEKEWFSGTSLETMFNDLDSNNNSIILERRIAKSLNLKIGDDMGVSFDSAAKTLKIVGFFGPEPTDLGGILPYATSTWSFVPSEHYNETSNSTSYQAKILLKLDDDANGTSVAETIRNLDLNIYDVDSFAEEWAKAQTNVLTVGSLDVQRLGVIFAILAASVGTALISVVSMKERSREATVMSVRGLSYRQLVWMFLTENLAVVTFSIILGVFVGFVIVYGNISSANAVISELVKRRFIFTLESALTLISFVSMIFASTILPIIVMSRQYVTKLERMVRLR